MENTNVIISLFLFCYMARLSMSVSKLDYNIKIIFNDSDVDLSNDVRFFLYTRENQNNPEQLWIGDKKIIEKSLFNPGRATKFMTHGWLNSYLGNNCQTVKNAFLSHDDYNVIVVDWGNIAKLPLLEVISFTKQVAKYIAKMIDFLASEGSNLSDMSLVGHSLGAHVMGLAGYQASSKIGHVVGLDPGAPGFTSAGPGTGISTSDATMVEIIHSNAGYWGLVKPVGHADFYANGGGIEQPGCGEDTDYYCAHDRAYIYYAEALTRPNSILAVRCTDYDTFLAGKCSNQTPVSFPSWSGADRKERGSYFLRTADKEPFGLGINGTIPRGSANTLVLRESLIYLCAIFILAFANLSYL